MEGTAIKKKKHKRRYSIDGTFAIYVIVLVVVGLITMFSAGSANAYYRTGDSFYYIRSQVVLAALGVIAMFVIPFFDYHILHKFALPVMAVSVILLVVTLFMRPINDARRWLIFGNFTFQTTELVKATVIIFFAHLISIYKEKMATFRYGVLPFGVTLVVLAVLILCEPHISGTIIIMLMGVSMMFMGGTKIKWFLIFGGAGAGAIASLIFFSQSVFEYAKKRIVIWRNPELEPLGAGMQTLQSLYAIGSGRFWGLGLGNSRQKYLYVPEPQNDFVFSIICEELGFIGAVMIMLLFAMLIIRGYKIAVRAKDRFGALLVMGVMAQLAIQTLLNIAVVTNSIPNTGISLPFFSFGGTSLFMLLCEMGMVLAVSRQADMERE